MTFTVGEILEGTGETLELAVRHAFRRKLPLTGATIPSGIRTEMLCTEVKTTGLGILFLVRLKVIEVP
jgi:hypothetical protein